MHSKVDPKTEVLVLVPTRLQISPETQACLEALPPGFCAIASLARCSDITLARNLLLTRAFHVLQDTPTLKGVLFLDDDVVFEPHQVRLLIDKSEEFGWRATAGVYGHENGDFAATFCKRSLLGPERESIPLFWVGLGFAFIPRELLIELGKVSKAVIGPAGTEVREFTRSCAGETLWMSEDYYLCNRFGGALLATVVGHAKRMVIYPDKQSFESLTAPRIGGQ